MPELDMRSFRSFTYRKVRCEWQQEAGNWEVMTEEGHKLMDCSDKEAIKTYIDTYLEAYYGTVRQ